MAKLNFKDRWVLVTGASSGLGREIARCMAKQEKAHLVITARRKERLEALKKEIESAGNTHVKVLQTDLSQTNEVDQLFKNATEIADIYAVVNNAGITYYNISKESELDTFERIININLRAAERVVVPGASR